MREGGGGLRLLLRIPRYCCKSINFKTKFYLLNNFVNTSKYLLVEPEPPIQSGFGSSRKRAQLRNKIRINMPDPYHMKTWFGFGMQMPLLVFFTDLEDTKGGGRMFSHPHPSNFWLCTLVGWGSNPEVCKQHPIFIMNPEGRTEINWIRIRKRYFAISDTYQAWN